MYNWRTKTADPCNLDVRHALKHFLLSKRSLFSGRLIDFFTNVCTAKSVLHLGFVEHSIDHINHASWKHATIASVARRTVGVDIAEEGVRAARQLGYECHAIDITSSASLGETFEVVIAGDIIEHLLSLDAVYQFSKRHMRQGSSLFISTPNPSCALWLPEVLLGATYVSNFEHTCWISPSHVNEHACRVDMTFERYYSILGGASVGALSRIMKSAVFRVFPELVAGTNVYELTLSNAHTQYTSEA